MDKKKILHQLWELCQLGIAALLLYYISGLIDQIKEGSRSSAGVAADGIRFV